MNNKYVLYHHGGSGNHGCEAIVRSAVKIIDEKVDLFSFRPWDDMKYGLDEVGVSVQGVKDITSNFFYRIYLYVMRHLFKNNKPDYKFQFQEVVKCKNKVVISIGGDLYCGSDTESLTYLNKLICNNNVSVLLGCSIEPEKMKEPEIVEDMHRYQLISARESITYNALKKAGVVENVILCADPAFQLDTVELPLPDGFLEGKTIGINASPLVIAREKKDGIIMETYDNLIQYIINNTDYQIALIPHVVWDGVSDLSVLQDFYKKYKHTGRVVLIEDHNCMELKGYIARCSMFIGARTHSTIAAYSSCVPTVVVGYSVKARGIAQDLFGITDNYVVSTQSLETGNELVEAFAWLEENQISIREHLKKIMPAYKESCYLVGKKIKEIVGEKH
ncbi:MAG: polysaccharide pyruvyl transferase family protein [Lachnoclostridium sp.]